MGALDFFNNELAEITAKATAPQEAIALQVEKYQQSANGVLAIGRSVATNERTAVFVRPPTKAPEPHAEDERKPRTLADFSNQSSPDQVYPGGVIGFNGCILDKVHNGVNVFSARREFSISKSPEDAQVLVAHATLFQAQGRENIQVGAKVILPAYSREFSSQADLEDAILSAYEAPGEGSFFIRGVFPFGETQNSKEFWRPRTDQFGFARAVSPDEGLAAAYKSKFFQYWLHMLPNVVHGMRFELVAMTRLWAGPMTRDRAVNSIGTKNDVFVPYLDFQKLNKQNDPHGTLAAEGREYFEVPVYAPSIVALRERENEGDQPFFTVCNPRFSGHRAPRSYLESAPTPAYDEMVAESASVQLSQKQKEEIIAKLVATYTRSRQDAEASNRSVSPFSNVDLDAAAPSENQPPAEAIGASEASEAKGDQQSAPASTDAGFLDDDDLMGAAVANSVPPNSVASANPPAPRSPAAKRGGAAAAKFQRPSV